MAVILYSLAVMCIWEEIMVTLSDDHYQIIVVLDKQTGLSISIATPIYHWEQKFDILIPRLKFFA